MDGIAKYLSTELPVVEVVWARYFFMVLITLPLFFVFSKKKSVIPKNLPIQLLRSVFLFLSTICFFYAISILSLAEALTLAFIYPMISTLLSSIILKEKVGLKRWTAVIIGFVGALIVLRPGFDIIHLASFAGLGTGVAYALYVISTKKLSTDNAFLTLVFSGLIGAKFGGASKKSVLLGMVGMVLGFLFFPPFGLFLGLFAGVFAGEMIRMKDHKHALKAAGYSFAGILAGMVFNVVLAIAFLVSFLVIVF